MESNNCCVKTLSLQLYALSCGTTAKTVALLQGVIRELKQSASLTIVNVSRKGSMMQAADTARALAEPARNNIRNVARMRRSSQPHPQDVSSRHARTTAICAVSPTHQNSASFASPPARLSVMTRQIHVDRLYRTVLMLLSPEHRH